MMVGAALAHCDDIDKIEEIGELLGMAYQMRDDLLDIIAGHDNKTSYSDLVEGNQTIVLYYALQSLEEPYRSQLLNYRGKHLSESDIQIINQLFAQSGAIEKTKQEINTHLNRAKELLKDLL
ncbi:MAG: polyprenyl synthetase family protein [Candidatus Peribacteria bacterium]|nr:MAG: polyprenyl synthetase family protein [Candidatus Peribacteria bacterium]